MSAIVDFYHGKGTDGAGRTIMNVYYYDGTFDDCHPDIVEGGIGWYFADDNNQIHGAFDSKAEAEEEFVEFNC